MPRVTFKTGFTKPDGGEEVLTEYLCDSPGCPKVGVHLLGFIRELRLLAIVCEEHLPPARRPAAP
jgi:hypothetical protein